MMPTKKRIAKQNERKKLFNALGSIPEHLVNANMSVNRDAQYVGIYKGGLVKFDKEGEPHLHEEIGKGGNQFRRDERRDKALELQHKYSAIWGKHGTAKRIAAEEQIPVRTVQQYIKDFPAKK